MNSIVQSHQSPYLDKKELTLEELQAASSVPIFIKYGSVGYGDNEYKNYFVFRGLVDVHGDDAGSERILPERVDIHNNGKLNDKVITPGGRVKDGFTPFGFTIDQIPFLKEYIVVMGMADGYRLHQATGLPVFCGMGENNLSGLVQQIKSINTTGRCIVAADNDRTGIISAHSCHTDFIIPSQEKDWSDIYQNQGADKLKEEANRIVKPLPLLLNTQHLFSVKRQLIKDELNKCINKLKRCETLADATSLSLSIFEKCEFKMPFEVMPNDLENKLIKAGKYTYHVHNIRLIKDVINHRIDKREKLSLSLTNFDYKKVKARHNVIRLNGLPKLTREDFKGVILMRAWKGIGKNDYIAEPYINAVRDEALTMAMCHRMSLTKDLCKRLELNHYQDDTMSIMEMIDLGACIPSIAKAKFKEFIDNLKYVFIDEIAQSLAFIKSKQCGTKEADNSVVYETLKNIIANVDCVLGVDAELNDTVIEFIESCRPDERFTIYDINESRAHNRATPEGFVKANKYPAKKANVKYITGKDSVNRCYGQVLAEVREGNNIWVALEACDRTKALADQIKANKPGVKVLVINKHTKNNKQVKKFLKDADQESLKYQVIIHSPVISSGISVSHKNKKPHFSKTFFLGGGFCISPSDASQMLARVRYVNDYVVALIPNNQADFVKDARSTIIGQEQAAIFEDIKSNPDSYDQMVAEENLRDYNKAPVDKVYRASEFDTFCAKIAEKESQAKADFSAGLLWLLEEEGHDVSPSTNQFENLSLEIKAFKQQAKDDFHQCLINAKDIDASYAYELSVKNDKTWEESCQYLKYCVMDQLNLKELTVYDLDIWDDGRVMAQTRRYAACYNQVAFNEKEDVKHLSHRKFSKAKVWGYEYIFSGIDISGKSRLTQENATEIIKRVIKHRYVLAEIGIVPRRFAKYYKADRNGNDTFPFPKTPMKDIQSIFRLMGFDLQRKSNCHRETNTNDYAFKAEEMQDAKELHEQIDFSRCGGYILNTNSGNAEINAEIWNKTKELSLAVLSSLGEVDFAVQYLNKQCEKHKIDKETPEVKTFYEHLRQVVG